MFITAPVFGRSLSGIPKASSGKTTVQKKLSGDSVHFSGKNEEKKAQKKERQDYLEMLSHHLNNDTNDYFDKIKKYYAWVHYKGGKTECQKRQLELDEIEKDYVEKGPLYRDGVELAKVLHHRITGENDLPEAMVQPSSWRYSEINASSSLTEPLIDKLRLVPRLAELKAILKHGNGEPYPEASESRIKGSLPYPPYEG